MIKGVIRYTPPKTWGVLCIDVWDNHGVDNKFYQGIINNLKKFNISTVVNCSVSQTLDYSNRSVVNTLRKYVWDNNPNIPNDIKLEIRDNLVVNSGEQKISKVLNDNLFDNNTVSLNTSRTFDYHVQSYHPDVFDWIIIGGAWNICLHAGPLGIGRILNSLPAYKFNIFPSWGIRNENRSPVTEQQVKDDNYVWAPIDDGGYRLVTVVGGKWQN